MGAVCSACIAPKDADPSEPGAAGKYEVGHLTPREKQVLCAIENSPPLLELRDAFHDADVAAAGCLIPERGVALVLASLGETHEPNALESQHPRFRRLAKWLELDGEASDRTVTQEDLLVRLARFAARSKTPNAGSVTDALDEDMFRDMAPLLDAAASAAERLANEGLSAFDVRAPPAREGGSGNSGGSQTRDVEWPPLTKADLEQFEKKFTALDVNGDGTLDPEELVNVLRDHIAAMSKLYGRELADDELGDIWDLADEDGGGDIDPKEFVLMMYLIRCTSDDIVIPKSRKEFPPGQFPPMAEESPEKETAPAAAVAAAAAEKETREASRPTAAVAEKRPATPSPASEPETAAARAAKDRLERVMAKSKMPSAKYLRSIPSLKEKGAGQDTFDGGEFDAEYKLSSPTASSKDLGVEKHDALSSPGPSGDFGDVAANVKAARERAEAEVAKQGKKK